MERRKFSRVQLVLFGIPAIFAGAALVPALHYAIKSFGETGFYEYGSLLFSDGTLLVASWQEFVSSILEALPVLPLIALSSVAFIIVLSCARIAKHVRRALLSIKTL